jgi:hypothetical protein
VPLRWPGRWRQRLVDACTASLPALLANGVSRATPPTASAQRGSRQRRHTLEIAAEGASGLVTVDKTGGRLLLFPPDDGLVLFTGERTGGEEPGRVGGLRVAADTPGTLTVRFVGPMLRFPDTTAFLDLERGLSRAALVEHADVALDFTPNHPDGTARAEFGVVRGRATLDGRTLELDGRGFASTGGDPGPWPRVRAALDLGRGRRLSLMVDLGTSVASGFLCRGDEHVAVVRAWARLGRSDDPLAGFGLDVELAGGQRLELEPQPIHRLPVVRGGGPVPVRLVYASCRLPGVDGQAGWCEIGGV